MRFAREIENDYGKPLRYSYFINTPYYLTDPPPNALGITRGEIPADEALRRWAYTQLAINSGHEIGSHMVGHYNGSDWSYDRWRQEVDMFDAHTKDRLFEPVLGSNGQPLFPKWSCSDPLATECSPVYPIYDEDGATLFDADGRASSDAIVSGRLVPYVMVGVRAPELGWNNNMLDVLAERGFRYDTSKVGALEWPGRTRGNLWELPVQMFPRTRSSRSILGMDYNFKVGGLTGAEVGEMYDRVVERAYQGERHPVFFCHHFSRWSGPDGVTYWTSLKSAVRKAAALDKVHFVSYVELVDLLDGGHAPEPAPFVGSPCSENAECSSVSGGFCMKYGDRSAGFCSTSCDRYCPDRGGQATTFCVSSSDLAGDPVSAVGSPVPAGVCVSRSESLNSFCSAIPGTTADQRERHNDPSRTESVCVPAE